MNPTQFHKRHPFGYVTILEVTVILVYLLAGTLAYFLNLSNIALYGLANFTLTLIVIIILTSNKLWPPIGFRAPKHRKDLLFFLVPLLPMLVNFIPGVEFKDPVYVSEVLAITLMVGFVEEVIFRGLMLNALKARGIWRAAITTALLFGLTHALNALTGKNLLDNFLQIGYATAIGFAFGALVLKKEILWPLVLIHTFTDFVNFIQKPGFTLSSSWQIAILAGLTTIFTAYGIYMLRHKTQACDSTTAMPISLHHV